VEGSDHWIGQVPSKDANESHIYKNAIKLHGEKYIYTFYYILQSEKDD